MGLKKKLIGIFGVAVLVLGAFFTGHSAGAASKIPGTSGDPLVTLSYLEERLTGAGGTSERVQLKKGESLVGNIGTGIIVLGGSVTAAEDGLVDVTAGEKTEEDTSLFLYHSYIVTEENGGCRALSGCTLLVCGEYELKR